MPSQSEEIINQGASTSGIQAQTKQDKKKNVPWIEKYRPQTFDEIMGKHLSYNIIFAVLTRFSSIY
jgi:hypothetical protein